MAAPTGSSAEANEIAVIAFRKNMDIHQPEICFV
jgi:hypothetical protein